MNMVEQSPSVNSHISSTKVNASVRPPASDEALLQEPATPVAPSKDVVLVNPSTTTSQSEPSTTAIDAFKSIEEISVDPATSELLVKVPSELVGRMIGKNGLVIKELQSHSGAFINMAKEGEVFRIARISGNYPETHLCALMLVARFTPRDDVAKHEKLESLITEFKKMRPLKPFLVENFNVPAEHVGRIIGRGGHTIRELQETSHARIDVPKAIPGVESHRVLTISGSPDEVAHCREMLKARIAGLDAREGHSDVDGHDSPGSSDASYRRPQRPLYGYPDGRLIAAGMYPPYPLFTQVPYGIEPLYGFSPYGYVPYPMPFHATEHLTAEISRVSLSPSVDSQDSEHLDVQPGFTHTPPPGAATTLHASAPVFIPTMQVESIVPVPADLVGRLIGRQGVAVKQLQAETKTRVDVLDPTPGSDPMTRFVRITALRPEHVRACENHIKARIAAHYGNTYA